MNGIGLRQAAPGISTFMFATDEQPYFTADTVSRIAEIVKTLQGDETIHALILEGGTRYFSAGASKELLLDRDRSRTNAYLVEIPRQLLAVPIPTIAAMAGHAIGGGLAAGLWCDIAVLAKESLYGANFMAIGFTPGMGATMLLEAGLGAPLARELLFTGRLVKGREIKRICCPLSYAVTPRHQVMDRALEIAHELATIPRESLVLLKKNIARRRREQLDRVVIGELRRHEQLFTNDVIRRRIRNHFSGL